MNQPRYSSFTGIPLQLSCSPFIEINQASCYEASFVPTNQEWKKKDVLAEADAGETLLSLKNGKSPPARTYLSKITPTTLRTLRGKAVTPSVTKAVACSVAISSLPKLVDQAGTAEVMTGRHKRTTT